MSQKIMNDEGLKIMNNPIFFKWIEEKIKE